MYGYENFIHLTAEEVLARVDQKKVFEYIFGHSIEVGQFYTSPFRVDSNPGCFFEQREDGVLLFMDFGEIKHKRHRSCIKAIMEYERLSFDASIQFIYKRFSDEKLIAQNLSLKSNYLSSEKPVHKTFNITYTKRPYCKRDSVLWSKWLITPSQLLEDNVFAIQRFITSSKKGTFYFYPPLSYAIDFVDAVKVYQPNVVGKGKWITNCDENHVGNIDNISETGDKLIITKSYKDHRILRNLFPKLNVIWFQNEGCSPDTEIVEELLQRYSNIVFLYDNDNTGKEASANLVSQFNAIRKDSTTSRFLPKKEKHKSLFGEYLKDLGEYINKEGKEYLQKTLKKIGL